jgi:hypothetical protein
MGKMKDTIIKHHDVAYRIIASKPLSRFAKRLDEHPNKEYVDLYKQWVGADIIIQSESHFMFCETIPDVDFEIVE